MIIPISSRCGTIFSSNYSTISPSNKEFEPSHASSTIFILENQMLHRDHNFFTALKWTRLTWSNNCSMSLLFTACSWCHTLCEVGAPLPNFLRAQSASQGPINALFYPHLRVGRHLHTRLSSRHGSDTNCKVLGHHSKRLAFYMELSKFLYTQDHPYV